MQELLSHPDKSLLRHLRGVLHNCRTFMADLAVEDDLRRIIEWCAVLHDLGKASAYFQKYIRSRTPDGGPVLGEKERKLTNHARISAWWTFLVVQRELESERWALPACLAVLKHHGNFADVDTMLKDAGDEDMNDMRLISEAVDYDAFKAILSELGFNIEYLNHEFFLGGLDRFYGRGIRRLRKYFNKHPDLAHFFDLNLVFSVLLSADKGEVIFDGGVYRRGASEVSSAAVDSYKSQKFPGKPAGLNLLREQVYTSAAVNIEKHADRHFLSINVPTGIGKTYTVLNAALKLRVRRPDLKKIIYCLPFTSVIDQNARVFQDILEADSDGPVGSDALMVYHHLSERSYKPHDGKKEDKTIEIDDNRAEYLLHAFESEISVTTFYQLLYGILSGRNREVRKLHSFANSIIILDEVQSIPIKYWPLVKSIFTYMAERFNITFILVTATMPLIFDESQDEILELVDDKEAVFRAMDRIDLDCSLLPEKMSTEEFGELLVNDLDDNPARSFLVIVNTRQCARELYEFVREHLELSDAANDNELFFLSTNVYPKERLERIRRIKQSCATAGDSNAENKRSIVISTQLVEAGVDIDLDIVYRDIAPLDSIFQACGRCNRNMRDGFRGSVKLVTLVNTAGKRIASRLYGGVLIDKSVKVLQNQGDVIPEAEFFRLSQEYLAALDGRINQYDSSSILKALERLQYDHAFNITYYKEMKRSKPNYDGGKPFELIEELETAPVYIMSFDEEARRLYDEFQALIEDKDMDKYERMRAVKNIYRAMSQFIVNVPAHHMPKDESRRLFIVDEYIQDLPYDTETGIQYGAQESGHASI